MSAQAGRRRVVVLGSTGSIGTNCLDVVAHFPDRFEVWGLCANTRWETLLEQAERAGGHAGWRLPIRRQPANWRSGSCRPGTKLLSGLDDLDKMVADPQTDFVVSAIVGAAGLTGTWLALEAGKTDGVANKETLVDGRAARHGPGPQEQRPRAAH